MAKEDLELTIEGKEKLEAELDELKNVRRPANVEALKQLSWNSKQLEVLEDSLEQSRGLPEVPGSYFTPRHVVNGARKVINEKDDPRETLIDYTRKINEELLRKRQEFNLPVE